MAEFRHGRTVLRMAGRAEPGSPLSHAEARELRDELRVAVASPNGMRGLARLLDASVAFDADHLLDLLMDQVLAGRVIVQRETRPAIDPTVGLDPRTLSRFAEASDVEAEKAYAVAIQIIGDDDEPIAGVRYRIELPGGGVSEGRTSADGQAFVFGMKEAGECRLTLPELDEEAWEPVSSSAL